MSDKKRNLLIAGGAILLFSLGIVFMLLSDPFGSTSNEKTKKKVITEKETEQLIINVEDSISETEKMESFIVKQLPLRVETWESYLSLSHEAEEDGEDPKISPLYYFVTGLTENEPTYFTSSLLPEYLLELYSSDKTKEPTEIIQQYLDSLSKNQTLKSVTYQFDIDNYGREMAKGELTLIYNDGSKRIIPFDLKKAEEDDGHHHDSYYISTPLTEMIE